MTEDTRKGGDGGNGNGGAGNGAGGFDDFFIRDRGGDGEPAEPSGHEDQPRGGFDPYEDYARAGAGAGARARQPGFDRGLVDSITKIIEGLASVAGDALAPGTRRQLEKALRDLLVILRDVIDAMIARIDSRQSDDFEIEEIPID